MAKKRTTRLAVIVGMNIAVRRKAKGWTQAYMAEQYGITSDSLSRLERGSIAPRFSKLEDLAALLQCRVADLFCTPEELRAEYADANIDKSFELINLDPKDKILEYAEKIILLAKLIDKN